MSYVKDNAFWYKKKFLYHMTYKENRKQVYTKIFPQIQGPGRNKKNQTNKQESKTKNNYDKYLKWYLWDKSLRSENGVISW